MGAENLNSGLQACVLLPSEPSPQLLECLLMVSPEDIFLTQIVTVCRWHAGVHCAAPLKSNDFKTEYDKSSVVFR